MSDPATARPTLAAVAARAGVSVSTASLVFSGAGPVAAATRERVLAAAAELDYGGPDPTAQALRRGRSGIVGIITEDTLSESFRDPINLQLLDGVGAGLEDGTSLLVIPLAPQSEAPAGAAMDAAILLGCSLDVAPTVDALRRRRVPVVAIEAERIPGVVSIDLDNRDASRRGAEHLAALGHRRVAIITLPIDVAREPGPLTAERLASSRAWGTLERLAGARAVFPGAPAYTASASTIAEGMRSAAGYLDVPEGERPTAIIAQSDLIAIGVIRAAEERGIAVPEQLSVLGFDGLRTDGAIAQVLTTLVQPAAEKGRAAAAAVRQAIAGDAPRDVLLTCELRRGTTTAAAPA